MNITSRNCLSYISSLYHAASQATLAVVREEYWLVSGKSEVKKIVKNCVKCKAASVPSHQLPDPRVSATFSKYRRRFLWAAVREGADKEKNSRKIQNLCHRIRLYGY